MVVLNNVNLALSCLAATTTNSACSSFYNSLKRLGSKTTTVATTTPKVAAAPVKVTTTTAPTVKLASSTSAKAASITTPAVVTTSISSSASLGDVTRTPNATISISEQILSSTVVIGNTTKIGNNSISSNTTLAASNTTVSLNDTTVNSNILVIGKAEDMFSATSGLQGYGIPFTSLVIPQEGTTLPALASGNAGNFGGLIVVGQVAYDYNGTWNSALSTTQWQALYDYQVKFGVRMVQYNVYPGAAFGVAVAGDGCCATGQEQYMSFTNTAGFEQAGLVKNAQITTLGVWHYPATVTNSTLATEIAQFAPNGATSGSTTAAVINNFDSGRQQMVFFLSWATEWSMTSNLLQHAYITWLTRGLYAGYRRVNFETQIDDFFLPTAVYYPANTTYRLSTDDMDGIAAWIPQVRAKMPPGSVWGPELGHNGNGNIIYAQMYSNYSDVCNPGPVYLDNLNQTPLEFVKPLGSSTTQWPDSPTVYGYSSKCLAYDPLEVWITKPANRDLFNHISHTFTHLELDNATYNDAVKEIKFNQAWLKATGLNAGTFASKGLIPPAITGLHNGDVLRAWSDSGLLHCVGDNTRPSLVNTVNPFHVHTTNVSADGFDGYKVIPRWATRIYYNCDTMACDLKEWQDTSAGVGNFSNLLNSDRLDTMRHLFGLHHAGYMFHQANMRNTGVEDNLSLFQRWINLMVSEFTSYVNWPMIALGQDGLLTSYTDRETRDGCNYGLTWTTTAGAISKVTVTANGNTCAAPIPVTVPGKVVDTQGFRTEQIGNDPLTVWVQLSGSPVTLVLSSALQ